ncbi:DNA primase [Nanohaloarchaea archaeon]|nr:DNA primase [Candidatus Nanohaloarchaea archaeon]
MGKVSQNSANYLIKAKIESNGVIEKSDVVGAIFGQTEGLLGEELDLRELRNHGKVGRFEVDLDNSGGSTQGDIEISTSLDAADTAILASSLETIEKVGPTRSDIRIEAILDVRSSKRDYILKRSKQLLNDMKRENPDMSELKQEIKQETREEEIIDYKGFQAGPEVRFSEEVILVEGVADVKNLVRNGVKNSVALGGTSVPDRIPSIVGDRKVTAFLDGDRGGDLILEELESKLDLDSVARAPENLEVEELSEKQIYEALRDKESSKYVESGEVREFELEEEERNRVLEVMDDLVATRAVNLLNDDLEVVEKFPADMMDNTEQDNVYAVLCDSEINEEIVNLAEDIDASYVIGRTLSGTANSSDVHLLSEEQFRD